MFSWRYNAFHAFKFQPAKPDFTSSLRNADRMAPYPIPCTCRSYRLLLPNLGWWVNWVNWVRKFHVFENKSLPAWFRGLLKFIYLISFSTKIIQKIQVISRVSSYSKGLENDVWAILRDENFSVEFKSRYLSEINEIRVTGWVLSLKPRPFQLECCIFPVSSMNFNHIFQRKWLFPAVIP